VTGAADSVAGEILQAVQRFRAVAGTYRI
jgi:hypothetical protein